jgi:hypothetical protein
MICKNCGVELEDDVVICPLCGEPVNDKKLIGDKHVFTESERPGDGHTMSQPQRKLTWEIVSLILLSAAIATFVVDFIINKRITWSEVPTACCLTIFCYVSLFAFWNQSTLMEMVGGFVLSAICLVILDLLTTGIQWSLRLGIPLLFASNLVAGILILIVQHSKYKGINLLAYGFLGAAVLCIAIEAIVSLFESNILIVTWSVIVASCILPVAVVLLVMHFRLKKGQSLEKTFHV